MVNTRGVWLHFDQVDLPGSALQVCVTALAVGMPDHAWGDRESGMHSSSFPFLLLSPMGT